MSKAIAGAAMIVAAIGMGAILYLDPMLAFTPGYMAGMYALAAGGISMEAGALAEALTSNRGQNITTRMAAGLRQIVYGMQRIGGVTIYQSTTGANGASGNYVYNYIIVLAAHQIDSIVNLYLDGRQVFWSQVPSSEGDHANVGCGTVSTPPTATVTIAGGAITSITATGGAGFANVKPVDGYRVRIVDSGGGSGAVAWAKNTGSAASPVWTVTVVQGGSNYTSATFADIQGAYTFGGAAAADQQDSTQPGYGIGYGIGPGGPHYNFAGKVYCEARFGDQLPGDVITNLSNNDATWSPESGVGSPWVGGCAYIYLNVGYDAANFPSAPEVRLTINGKNTIYDPRSGKTGFSSNWALIVADAISDPVYGLGDSSINEAQLIAAANVCDEEIATSQGNERNYALHIHYDTSTSPGDALALMMPAACGKVSYIGGQWYIWPAYWQAPSFTFNESALIEAPTWNPYRSFKDLFNRVNGTYIAPNFPYNCAGNLYDKNGFYYGAMDDVWPFAWQPTNFPQYACDTLHGYSSDAFLADDGGVVLPKELTHRGVISIVQAQRTAKILLLRNRQQGSGSFPMQLAAWQMQPLDVMLFNFPVMNWTNKYFEVDKIQFVCQPTKGDESEAPAMALSCMVSVVETDPSVYEWATSEELTPYDVAANPWSGSTAPAAPTAVTLENDANTSVMLSNGTSMSRLLVTWTPPADVYVTQGGTIQIQYSLLTNGTTTPKVPVRALPTPITTGGVTLTSVTAWIDAGSVQGDASYFYIDGLADTQAVQVQIRAVRSNGSASAWVLDTLMAAATPIIINRPVPLLTIGGSGSPVFTFSDSGALLSALEPKEPGANVTSGHVLTSVSSPTSGPTALTASGATIPGMGFTLTAASASDVYNMWGNIFVTLSAAQSYQGGCQLGIFVDGAWWAGAYLNVDAGPILNMTVCPFFASLTGLSAGSHTITFQIKTSVSGYEVLGPLGGSGSWGVPASTYAICQRIF